MTTSRTSLSEITGRSPTEWEGQPKYYTTTPVYRPGCEILGGKCACIAVGELPFCKKYGTLKALEIRKNDKNGI